MVGEEDVDVVVVEAVKLLSVIFLIFGKSGYLDTCCKEPSVRSLDYVTNHLQHLF